EHAGEAARVRDLRDPGQAALERLAALVDDAVDVGDDDVAGTGRAQQTQDRGAGRARAGEHDPGGGDVLLHDAQGVAQRGDDDDRGAVLVVVEDGDVQLLAQTVLDLEAARGGDVLEVDAGEDRGDRLDVGDDVLDRVGVQADRERIDPGEALEQRRLALHDGHRGERPQIAEAQDRGAVGDDRDGVALDGQAAGVLGVLRDRLDHAGHARGVDHREVVAVADRELRLDGELASQVREEGAVGDLAELDAIEAAQALDDLHGVIVAGGEHGDVRAHALRPGGGDVQRGDRRAVLLDAGGDVADRGAAGGELQADGDGVADGWHR